MRAKSLTGNGKGPEIARLLRVRTVVQSLIQKADAILDANNFPKTSRSTDLLAKHFEAEIESNLLKTYRSLDDHSV